MTRNCKVGDFAIWVGIKADPKGVNYGKVVRCLKFIGSLEGHPGEDRWLTDTPMVVERGPLKSKVHNTARDISLRPIRGTFEEIVAQVVAFRLTNKL